MAALTSKDVNFLVYRYLLEAGFSHAAFVFGAESGLERSDVRGGDVPVGALVSFVQKGFQFAELEANLTEEGEDVYRRFTPISAHDLMTKDLEELRLVVGEAATARDARLADPLIAGGVGEWVVTELPGHTGTVAALQWAPELEEDDTGGGGRGEEDGPKGAAAKEEGSAEEGGGGEAARNPSGGDPSTAERPEAAPGPAPEGELLATCAEDGILRLWAVPLGEAVRGGRVAGADGGGDAEAEGVGEGGAGAGVPPRAGTAPTPAAGPSPMDADGGDGVGRGGEGAGAPADEGAGGASAAPPAAPPPVPSSADAPAPAPPLPAAPRLAASSRAGLPPSGALLCAAWTQDGKTLATGSFDGQVLVWDRTGSRIGGGGGRGGADGSGHPAPSRGASSGHGTTLGGGGGGTGTGTGGGGASRGGGTGGSAGGGRGSPAAGAPASPPVHHAAGIFGLRWNRRGELLLSCSADATAIVWDGRTGTARFRTPRHPGPVLDADWRTAAVFATAAVGGRVALWRVGEPRPLREWRGHERDVNSIRWDPSGKLLASASSDGSVRVWALTSDTALRTFEALPGREFNCVRWGTYDEVPHLASACSDGTVRVWDADSWTLSTLFDGHDAPVAHVAWNPALPYLASGDEAGGVLVWDAGTGAVVRELRFAGEVQALEWDRGGVRLAVAFGKQQSVVVIADLR